MSRRIVPGLIALVLVLSCHDLRSPTDPSGNLGLPAFAVRNVGCDVEGLRAAINAANRDAEADVINLEAGCTYTVSDADNIGEPIENVPSGLGSNAFPVIISPITINGNGATIQRSTVGGNFRFFFVLNGAQYVMSGADYVLTTAGGAKGSLRLNNVTLSGGRFSNAGGALYVLDAPARITNSRIVGNESGDHGGALNAQGGATVSIEHTRIEGNSSGDNGGGVHNQGGTVDIRHSTIADNISYDNGAALSNAGGGVLTLYYSTVSGHDIGDHGALYNDGAALEIINSTITGASASDGGAAVHNVGATATVAITGSFITENVSADAGGGIVNHMGTVTLLRTTVSHNAAGDNGGGIQNHAGTVQIDQSTIANNTAGDNGAGLSNEQGGVLVIRNSFFWQNAATEAGGGLYNYDATATVVGTTIAGNTASQGAGIADEGGELEAAEVPACDPAQPCEPAEPGEPVGGVLTVLNSTISGNQAGESGGGIFSDAGGRLTITGSTITGNTAAVKTGGGVMSYNNIDGLAEIRATIIVGNSPNDLAAVERKTTFTSRGYNLVGTAGPYVDFSADFTAPGDQTNVSLSALALGELQDNGGAAKTHALLAGSIALDAIPAAECPAAEDQRGVSRPQPAAGGCDVGAFEANSAKQSQAITFAPPASPRQYGDRFTVAPTSSSGLPVALKASGGCAAVQSADGYVVTMTSGVTDCTLKASQAGDAAFAAAAAVTRVVAAARRELTVTARTERIPVGTSPSLGVDYAGFVGWDSERSLGGSLVYTFTGTDFTTYGPSTTVPSGAGRYSVMPGGRTSDNYSFKYVAGALTIFAGIRFESYVSAYNDGGTTLTIAIPVGTRRGDLLLAQITFEKGSVAGTNEQMRPLGWRTVRRTDNGTDFGQAIFYRIVTGNEGITVTSTFGQRVAAAGAILRYTGVNTTAPIISSSGRAGISDVLTAPTVQAEANSMAVGLFAIKRKMTSLSTPSEMTARYYFESPLNLALLGADRIKAGAGPHWSKSSTAGVADKWVAQQVSVRPD
jgi:hypothetical protein